jgi:hypothetical protein
LAKAPKTELLHLPPLIGAWCSLRRADHRPPIRRRTYWWPLYGFVRRNGYKPEEAQDLTQGFFALLLERRDLDVVRREKGRLRSYLLVSLKNFLAKARRRELTTKRGEGRALVPLHELLERERADLEPADTLTADRIFERRWALNRPGGHKQKSRPSSACRKTR